jgi:hypothetical protein
MATIDKAVVILSPADSQTVKAELAKALKNRIPGKLTITASASGALGTYPPLH